MDDILSIKDLNMVFTSRGLEGKEKVHVLKNVNFSVKSGEIVALVGESGCGKSVTANSIMQLLPMPPAFFKGGEIIFNGDNLLTKSDKEMQTIRGNQISMVFQDPMTSLNPTMRIGKQIVEGLVKHQKLSNEEARKRLSKC